VFWLYIIAIFYVIKQSMKYTKQIYIAVLSLLLCTNSALAQGCPKDVNIYGPAEIKKGTSNERSIAPKSDTAETPTFQLFKNEKLIESRNTEIFRPAISSAGNYKIKAEIHTPDCNTVLEKNITSYKKFLVYI
jgi:hypothetical protein